LIAVPIIIPTGEMRAVLAPLPVAALRLDPVLVEGLHRVGLRRVGEVLAMPRDALARRFALIGGAHHVHRDEGRHQTAPGRSEAHWRNLREKVAIGEGHSL